MASALQNVDENKWTYKENATPSPTLVNVVVVLIPFRIPSRLERPHLHHCMHSQHGLSPRKGSKHVVLSIMQNHGRYSVLTQPAKKEIRQCQYIFLSGFDLFVCCAVNLRCLLFEQPLLQAALHGGHSQQV